MPFIIFLLLISAEIASIVVVGSRLGILGTLALQAFAMLLGLTAFRHIGFVLRPQAREDGTLAREAIGVLLVALSAIALLIPGFFLDIPALILLLPPVRNAVAGTLAQRGFESVQWPGGPATGGQRPGGPTVDVAAERSTSAAETSASQTTARTPAEVEILPPPPRNSGGGEPFS